MNLHRLKDIFSLPGCTPISQKSWTLNCVQLLFIFHNCLLLFFLIYLVSLLNNYINWGIKWDIIASSLVKETNLREPHIPHYDNRWAISWATWTNTITTYEFIYLGSYALLNINKQFETSWTEQVFHSQIRPVFTSLYLPKLTSRQGRTVVPNSHVHRSHSPALCTTTFLWFFIDINIDLRFIKNWISV